MNKVHCVAVLSILLPCLFIGRCVAATSFTSVDVGLSSATATSLSLVDYDSDGDIDILAGCSLYRNTAATFASLGVTISGASPYTWGDYDSDGDMDVATGVGAYIYKNNDGVFTNISAGLVRTISYGCAEWGDYDNDGDLDLALTGHGYFSSYATYIYRNDDGTFADASSALTKMNGGILVWNDYDNDGDLDILTSGYSSTYIHVTKLYSNSNGIFTDTGCNIPDDYYYCFAWGDYDSDGDSDILVAGTDGTFLYRNDGGTFVNTGYEFPSCRKAAWGDYDNDGNIDLVCSVSVCDKYNNCTPYTYLYHNDGGIFTCSDVALTGQNGDVAFADYDNDGDLDIVVSGSNGTTSPVTFYRNDGTTANTPPSAPTNLSATMNGSSLVLGWNPSSDDKTPSAGLTYDIRIGTTPGGEDICAGQADLSTGYRRLPRFGKINANCSWPLCNAKAQTYYWSVQAVDGSLAGSQWTTEYTVTPLTISGYVRNDESEGISGVTITADGMNSSGITDSDGYYSLQVLPGWTGNLTASKNGYHFTPSELALSNVSIDTSDQNFTARPWFASTNAGLLGVTDGSVAWGDYDGDGDLDLALAGRVDDTTLMAAIYRNDDGTFVNADADLTGVENCSLAWGDYDGDGDLDLAIAGLSSAGRLLTIYRNDNGTFSDIVASLAGFSNCSIAWADYDNDGDLDLSVTGLRSYSKSTSTYRSSVIYRNDDGAFASAVTLIGLQDSAIAWADRDCDGDLDPAICGYSGSTAYTYVYWNSNGSLGSVSTNVIAVGYGCVAWDDFNNDGYPDLAIAGESASGPVTEIYNTAENTYGTLTQSEYASLTGVSHGAVAWGDFDNDGDSDLAVAGASPDPVALIYQNNDGTFSAIDAAPTGVENASLAWGDYDGDGDLDLVISGESDGTASTIIYRNDLNNVNTVPSTPSNLSAAITTGGIALSWDASSDTETPAAGLTYNIRVGSQSGASDIYSGMADTSSGQRLLPARGNAQQNLTWTVKNPPSGTIYWSVQAIDSGFKGSEWATESSISFVTISGHVYTSSGSALSSVTVTPDNDGIAQTTNSSGYYCLFLSPGWSGTVAVSKSNYRFEAASRSYSSVNSDITDQDYTGRAFFSYPYQYSYAALPALMDCSIAWGDYDQDGDLDLAIAGYSKSSSSEYTPVAKILNNSSGTFSDSGISLTGVQDCSLAWGDYDGDGDLDLALAGSTSSTTSYIAKVYRNNNGSFEDINAGLAGVYKCGVAWGDYDNDGDLDLLISGQTTSGSPSTTLYRNDKGTFVAQNLGITDMPGGAVAWADYDGDGDLDITVAGIVSTSSYAYPMTKILRNDGGAFYDISAGITGLADAAIAWTDYDGDGDLDLAMSGNAWCLSIPIETTILYRNDTGTFVDAGASLPDVMAGSLAWADYDNDGDLDLLSVGAQDYKCKAELYENNSGAFTGINSGLPGMYFSSVAWGDYDGDGKLDIAMAGFKNMWPSYMSIVRNETVTANTVPNPPSNLAASISGQKITFTWQPGSDSQTAANNLTYNIRVGTGSGLCDVVSPMSDSSSGYRWISAFGNCGKLLSYTLNAELGHKYYWAVQTIDSAFSGSTWAEQTVTLPETCTIPNLRQHPDNTAVACESAIVTAVFNGFFYVEDINRTCGMRVNSSASVVPGTKVRVDGILETTDSGERYIQASEIETVSD